MEIEDTPLYDEAQDVLWNGSTTANLMWKVRIHYGDDQYLDPLYVIAVNHKRDYHKTFADIKTVSVTMGLGDYSRLIYPNRVGLEITLTQVPLVERSEEVDTENDSAAEKYSASLLDGPKAPTIAQGAETNDYESLNKTQMVDVHFQLFDKALEQIRTMLTGGTIRTNTVGNAIKHILTTQAKTAKVKDQVAVTGVDMIDPDNTDLKGQMVITHGTRLVDVPDFIQRRYGVYNAGIGSYIQNKTWYVYPLYDTTDFKKRQKTLTILILPKRKFNNVERTFKQTGDSLVVISTSDTGFKDDSGTNYLNGGNGVRFSNASSIMESSVTTANNKARLNRGKNNFELAAGEAVSGVNHADLSSNRITANPFVEFTKLAARNGGLFTANWQNSDISLLFPGMATKIVYADGEDVKTIYGILLFAEQVSHRLTGISSNRFVNQTSLHVFVNSQVTNIDE